MTNAAEKNSDTRQNLIRKPIADNTLPFRWIVTIQGGLDAWFRHDPNVFVAEDPLWPQFGLDTIKE